MPDKIEIKDEYGRTVETWERNDGFLGGEKYDRKGKFGSNEGTAEREPGLLSAERYELKDRYGIPRGSVERVPNPEGELAKLAGGVALGIGALVALGLPTFLRALGDGLRIVEEFVNLNKRVANGTGALFPGRLFLTLLAVGCAASLVAISSNGLAGSRYEIDTWALAPILLFCLVAFTQLRPLGDVNVRGGALFAFHFLVLATTVGAFSIGPMLLVPVAWAVHVAKTAMHDGTSPSVGTAGAVDDSELIATFKQRVRNRLLLMIGGSLVLPVLAVAISVVAQPPSVVWFVAISTAMVLPTLVVIGGVMGMRTGVEQERRREAGADEYALYAAQAQSGYVTLAVMVGVPLVFGELALAFLLAF